MNELDEIINRYKPLFCFKLVMDEIDKNPDLSLKSAFKKVVKFKDDKEFEMLSNFVLGYASGQFINEIFVFMEEFVDNNLVVNNFTKKNDYDDVLNEIFKDYPELKNESPSQIFKSLRNAFAHRQIKEQLDGYGHYNLRYYSQSQKRGYDLEVKASQMLTFLLLYFHSCQETDWGYKCNMEKAKPYFDIKTINIFFRKAVFKSINETTKETKRVVLDDWQRECMTTLFLAHKVEKISINFLLMKVLPGSTAKIMEKFRQTLMMSQVINHNKSMPYKDVHRLSADFISHIMPSEQTYLNWDVYQDANSDLYKYSLHDCSAKMVSSNALISCVSYLLSQLESRHLLYKLASREPLAKYFQNMSEQESARRCKRIRNSLVHGRYIFDCDIKVYLYDGKDKDHLEKIMTLDLNDFERLSREALGVLEESLEGQAEGETSTNTTSQMPNANDGDSQHLQTQNANDDNIQNPQTQNIGNASVVSQTPDSQINQSDDEEEIE